MPRAKTRLDSFNAKIKNNPIVAGIVILGTIVIALSTFTDAAKNLLALITSETRPPINGAWKAEVIYDWDNTKYVETFIFDGEGSELYGAASFLKAKRGILEGKVAEDKIEFITKTQQTLSGSEPRDSIHHYRGRLVDDEIKFVMQTEGGYTQHVPIMFTAKRSSGTSP